MAGRTRGGEHSGPRSGKNAPKKGATKRGKPKMSAAAWAKLSNRQKQDDYNGSRFMSVGTRSKAKEAGHKPGRSSPAAGRGRPQGGPAGVR